MELGGRLQRNCDRRRRNAWMGERSQAFDQDRRDQKRTQGCRGDGVTCLSGPNQDADACTGEKGEPERRESVDPSWRADAVPSGREVEEELVRREHVEPAPLAQTE